MGLKTEDPGVGVEGGRKAEGKGEVSSAVSDRCVGDDGTRKLGTQMGQKSGEVLGTDIDAMAVGKIAEDQAAKSMACCQAQGREEAVETIIDFSDVLQNQDRSLQVGAVGSRQEGNQKA